MDAVISGHAGVALVVDSSGLTSIHVEHPEEVIPRQESEIHLLFGGARDLQFLADVDLEQVRAQLELAGARIDALHLALIILDRELSEETRQQAALELNELMGLLEIADFLERVLYAYPLPGSADLSGSLLSVSQSPKVQDLLLALAALQETILEVHRAWEAIPAKVFDGEEERFQIRALFTREGLFKALVLNREEGATIDSFLLSSSLRPELRSIPNYRIILEEWLTYFQQEAPVKKTQSTEGLKSGEALESLGELEKKIVMSESVLQEPAQDLEQVFEKSPPELQPRIRNIRGMYLLPKEDGMSATPKEDRRMSAIPKGDGMDIVNNTGNDAKYRVGSSGPQGVNPRPGSGWRVLPKRCRLKHRLDQPGPWRVEFLVQSGGEEISASNIAHTANDLVELTGGDGNYDVVVTRVAAG